MEKSIVFNNSVANINYEAEYKRLFEENILLKEENATLKETVVKLAVRL